MARSPAQYGTPTPTPLQCWGCNQAAYCPVAGLLVGSGAILRWFSQSGGGFWFTKLAKDVGTETKFPIQPRVLDNYPVYLRLVESDQLILLDSVVSPWPFANTVHPARILERPSILQTGTQCGFDPWIDVLPSCDDRTEARSVGGGPPRGRLARTAPNIAGRRDVRRTRPVHADRRAHGELIGRSGSGSYCHSITRTKPPSWSYHRSSLAF